MSLTKWAALRNVRPSTARAWAAKGKIEGAQLIGKSWAVPDDAEPPKLKRGNPNIVTLRKRTLNN